MSNLKYLFECHFSDGTFLTQTQEDVSLTTPGKNAFFDVIARMDDVVTFGLFSDEDPNVYAIHLDTGMFSINDVEFQAQDPRTSFENEDAKFRLIFFKRHVHSYNSAYGELSHAIAYHLGWQRTSGGVNHQSTISVE